MPPLTLPRAPSRPRGRRPALLLAVAALVLPLWGTAGPARATTSDTVTVQPGRYTWLQDGPAFQDGFARSTITVPSSSSRPLRLSVQTRSSAAAGGYRSSLEIAEDGALTLSLSRVQDGAEHELARRDTGTRVQTGQQVTLQNWTTGDRSVVIRARSWVGSSPKPDWQVSHTDDSPSRLSNAAPARAEVFVHSRASAAARLPVTLTGSRQAVTRQSTGPTVSGGPRLSAAQVGVPAGTTLRRHDGDIVVTEPGTVLDGLDVHGFVVVRAPDVRITNSVIRGGTARWNGGLITSLDQPGLVVEDVDLVPEHPSVLTDGILGNNFTLRRVHIDGGVDNVKVQGDHVRVESSLLEGLDRFPSDPNQGGGPTHNDNVQILHGDDVTIQSSTILAGDNFAVLAGAEWGPVNRLTLVGNYLDGGHCNVKLAAHSGHPMSAGVRNNVFGPHRDEQACPLVADRAVGLTMTGNVYEDDGRTVTAVRI